MDAHPAMDDLPVAGALPDMGSQGNATFKRVKFDDLIHGKFYYMMRTYPDTNNVYSKVIVPAQIRNRDFTYSMYASRIDDGVWVNDDQGWYDEDATEEMVNAPQGAPHGIFVYAPCVPGPCVYPSDAADEAPVGGRRSRKGRKGHKATRKGRKGRKGHKATRKGRKGTRRA